MQFMRENFTDLKKEVREEILYNIMDSSYNEDCLEYIADILWENLELIPSNLCSTLLEFLKENRYSNWKTIYDFYDEYFDHFDIEDVV